MATARAVYIFRVIDIVSKGEDHDLVEIKGPGTVARIRVPPRWVDFGDMGAYVPRGCFVPQWLANICTAFDEASVIKKVDEEHPGSEPRNFLAKSFFLPLFFEESFDSGVLQTGTDHDHRQIVHEGQDVTQIIGVTF